MEKIKFKKPGRSKNERIGLPTGLFDKNKKEIHTGDFIRYFCPDWEWKGIVLWHNEEKAFGIFMGCWYLDKNIYDSRCYGKFIKIPKDNGMRMNLEIITKEDMGEY